MSLMQRDIFPSVCFYVIILLTAI